MARTLAQVNEQIAKLQREADALQAKEAADVIARIREAIEHYGLTAEDLFEGSPSREAKARAPARATDRRKGASAGARKRAAGADARKSGANTGARKRAGTGARKSGVIRYRDEAGNSWTGHGKRPNWFKAAIEAGKTPEDLAVKDA